MGAEETPVPETGAPTVFDREFDLARFMADGEHVVGFAASVKYLDEEGNVRGLHVWNGMTHYEAKGMYSAGESFAQDAIDRQFYGEEE